jgi:hypothetical protein
LCVKVPEVPVTVSVYVPFAVLLFGGEYEPEQAAMVAQTKIAETIARRVRRRCVDRIRYSSISATKSGTIRSMLSGGAGLEIGNGTSMPCAVNVSEEVVGGVMEVGLSTQEEYVGVLVHVRATAELNPFVGFTVIVTGELTPP